MHLVLRRTHMLVWKGGVAWGSWWVVVCTVCFGVSKGGGGGRGREERQNLIHILEEDLDLVQLDQEFIMLLYLVWE
jgi:hypothetical protein